MKKLTLFLTLLTLINPSAFSYAKSHIQNEDVKSLSDIQSAILTTTGNLTNGNACITSPASVVGLDTGQFIYDSSNPTYITSGTTIAGLPGSCSAGQIQMSTTANHVATGDTLTFGGQVSQLINDAKMYVTGASLNSQLSTLLTNNSIINTSSTNPVTIPANLTFSGTVGLSTPLAVGSGGTGRSTLTTHDLILGAGTSLVTLVAPSATTGVPLISNGSSVDPSFGQLNLASSSAVTGTLAVTNGGTGTGTAFTTGSVVFADGSGVYSQDNSKLFWDNTNFFLGVGSASPAAQIEPSATQPTGTFTAAAAGSRMLGNINLQATDSYTTQKAGRITFSGLYTSGNLPSTFGAIQGFKDNSSDGVSGGGLQFLTGLNSTGAMSMVMSLDQQGYLYTGSSIQNYPVGNIGGKYLAIAWNFAAGQQEIDFFNTATSAAARSFSFFQQTASNAATEILRLDTTSGATLSVPLAQSSGGSGTAGAASATLTSGGTGGSAAPALTSGLYSPTVTNVNGVSTITSGTGVYSRVGNVVTVSGEFTATLSIGSNSVTITLPTTTANFTTNKQGGGSVIDFSNSAINMAAVVTNTGAQNMLIQWGSATSGAGNFQYIYSYQIQ